MDRNTRLKTGFGGLIPLFFLSGKKEARASEYWASESDDYALPDTETGQYKRGRNQNIEHPDLQQPAFTSARAAVVHSPKYKRGKTARQYEEKTAEDSPPRPPPGTVIRSSKLEYPEPLPFSFNGQPVTKKEEPAELDFKRAHASSLNLMKTLGLPSPAAFSSGAAAAPLRSGLNSFQQSSNSSLAFMKDLGLPDPQSATTASRTNLPRPAGPAAGVPGGPRPGSTTKRLGMGRAPAPWGSTKP